VEKGGIFDGAIVHVYRTLHLERWILDLGSWILDLGSWILDLGSWILDLA
jgi:hypothetical protein